jgi:hypothetical protein
MKKLAAQCRQTEDKQNKKKHNTICVRHHYTQAKSMIMKITIDLLLSEYNTPIEIECVFLTMSCEVLTLTTD